MDNRGRDDAPTLFDADAPTEPPVQEPGGVRLAPAEEAALTALATDPLSLMAPDWAAAMAPLEETLRRLGRMLERENDAGHGFLPPPSRVLRAFTTPLTSVKVLIVGQDPYPTPGHSVGRAFAVDRRLRPLPRSLNNIYKELHDDLGVPPAPHGDLEAWAHQGVLLLNRVLTVRPGATGSHRGRGWEEVTELAIRVLAARDHPLVSVLWGRDAQRLEPLLAGTAVISSAHPSPLSASRGFFGSRPFSRINQLLLNQGATPIDWALSAE